MSAVERPYGAASDLVEVLQEWNLLTLGWEDDYARDCWETENRAFGDTYPSQFNPDFEDDLRRERELDRLDLEEWKSFMERGIQRSVLRFKATGKRTGELFVKLPGKPVISALVYLKLVTYRPAKRSVRISEKGKAYRVVILPVTKNFWEYKKAVPDEKRDIIDSVAGLYYLDRMTGAGLEEGFNRFVPKGEPLPTNKAGEAEKGRIYVTTAPLPEDEIERKIEWKKRPKRPAPSDQRQAVLGDDRDEDHYVSKF